MAFLTSSVIKKLGRQPKAALKGAEIIGRDLPCYSLRIKTEL